MASNSCAHANTSYYTNGYSRIPLQFVHTKQGTANEIIYSMHEEWSGAGVREGTAAALRAQCAAAKENTCKKTKHNKMNVFTKLTTHI